MSFSLIACIGKNNELGKNNQLIFHLKKDLCFFRETTMGYPVVMGRKTFESIGKKLPGRKNYVVSSSKLKNLDSNIIQVSDLKSFINQYLKSSEKFFVIGGGKIYAEFLPFANELFLTEVDAEDSTADTFFPDFDKTRFRRKILQTAAEGNLNFSFVQYIKKEI